MNDERNQEQIIRKDARNCFVESKNDSFDRNRIHFFFATYDTSKPEGARYINTVNIYIPAEEFLELCRKLGSGELKYIVKEKKKNNDESDIYKTMGGTSAERLKQFNKERTDGMSLSRCFRISIGRKTEVALTADSGPGETDEKGLIVPRYKGKPENHVAIGMSFDDFSELMLMTKAHFDAWLTARYMGGVNVAKSTTSPIPKPKTVAPKEYDTPDYVVAEPPKNAVESFFA